MDSRQIDEPLPLQLGAVPLRLLDKRLLALPGETMAWRCKLEMFGR
jgi:hypothetical protein